MIIKPIKLAFPDNNEQINDKFIFFDIQHINNKIIIIMPVYSKIPQTPDTENLRLLHNSKELHFTKKYVRLSYEPTIVIIYDFVSDNNENTIIVEYNNIQKEIVLQNVKIEKKYNLTLTTLFKDDYYLLNIFYNYYKSQGVEHFYLYYNGIIDDLVDKLDKNLINNKDITFIEWNYKYWNDVDKNKNYDKNKHLIHHAQLGQIHSALYMYGKNSSEYMIFCDLDEYITISDKKNMTIREYINDETNSKYECFVFKNCWSKTLDSKIPDIFPDKFLTSKPLSFPSRSKCIYKTDKAITLGIHEFRNFLEYNANNNMYHFYNWTNKNRIINGVDIFYDNKNKSKQ